MPQIVNRDAQTSDKKSSAQQSAVVKKARASNDEPRSVPVWLVVGAGALAVLLVAFLIHTYVRPFTPQVKPAHKVAPLPGMADVAPYNIKEWQDMYKSGKATFASGIPHVPVGVQNGAGKP